MNDEHKPKSTCGEEWFTLEDGFTSSRRATLTETPATHHASVLSAVLAEQTVEPAALAKTPDLSGLLLKALRLFDTIGAHIPERISDEELGDALEALHKMVQEGQPKWKIQARILSTLCWVSAHSVQDCVHEFVGMETAAAGSSNGKGNE
jgi:hypothetical protein